MICSLKLFLEFQFHPFGIYRQKITSFFEKKGKKSLFCSKKGRSFSVMQFPRSKVQSSGLARFTEDLARFTENLAIWQLGRCGMRSC